MIRNISIIFILIVFISCSSTTNIESDNINPELNVNELENEIILIGHKIKKGLQLQTHDSYNSIFTGQHQEQIYSHQ